MSTEMQAQVLEAKFRYCTHTPRIFIFCARRLHFGRSSIRTLEFDEDGESTLLTYSKRNLLTARGIVRLARVARTVADLSHSASVTSEHVLEAAMFQGRARA